MPELKKTCENPGWSDIRFNFETARVLITGGTSGIGLAIAKAFAASGAEVVVTGTRAKAGDYGEALEDFEYYSLQLTELNQIDRLANSLGHLDILVNNAGATYGAEDFEKEVTVNLTAVHRLTTACAPLLKQSQITGGASVINIASMMSYFGSPYFPGYGAAKAGIVQMTKTYAALWGTEGVRVNAVAAGSIATRMTDAYVNDTGVNQMVSDKTPMGRWGMPAEIAGAVLYLCSSAASFITGHTLVADGGYSIID